jgi:hypothetical protein
MEQAYALCYNWYPQVTTAELDTLVRLIRFDRQAGASAGDIYAASAPTCEGEPDVRPQCLQCLTALIDAVY